MMAFIDIINNGNNSYSIICSLICNFSTDLKTQKKKSYVKPDLTRLLLFSN